MDTPIQRRDTADPRVKKIYWATTGQPGQGHIFGPYVPEGKIWVIESCGIATHDGRPFEWMMQVAISDPHGTGGYWLVPCHRPTGTAGGTPVLAMDRRIILTSGRALAARVNGLVTDGTRDNRMGLLFDGWEVDENYLGKLIGLGES